MGLGAKGAAVLGSALSERECTLRALDLSDNIEVGDVGVEALCKGSHIYLWIYIYIQICTYMTLYIAGCVGQPRSRRHGRGSVMQRYIYINVFK